MNKIIIPAVRLIRPLFVALTIGTLAPGALAAIWDRDHLVPLRGKEEMLDRSWKVVLERKLFVTPGDYARFVAVIGGINGEWATSVYSNSKSPTGVTATYTEAEENLGYATWKENPHRKSERLIKVKRLDAVIPQSTAVLLRAAWMSMITRKRELVVAATDPDSVIVDGSRTLFSVKTNRGQLYEGLRVQHTKGKLITRLERLTNVLVCYCKAAPGRRPSIARQIEMDAQRLIAEVKATDRRR